VTENGGRRKVTKRQAIISQLVNRSATADFRAIKILLDLVRDIEGQTEPASPESSAFSEAHEKVIEQLKMRFNPQTRLAMNWHLRVIAAKLTAVREGRIRRVIINLAHRIDFIRFIFHPTRQRRPVASLDGSRVE
jgi:hypothetical protein